MTRRCIVVLGGSFDPVHLGHVALAEYFIKLLTPDELRLLPTGNPWQKNGLQAAPADRIEMLRLAFQRQPVPVVIDDQEIRRGTPTYTIDTLRALRTEFGATASIVFLLGADQLQQLHTWHEWKKLFDYAHLCAASRPGFATDSRHLAPEVAREFSRRGATAAQMRDAPNGLSFLASNLAIDVSAARIRSTMQQNASQESFKPQLPTAVLDYIEQHHLYRT